MNNMKRTLMAIGLAYSTQAATVVHTVTINPTLTDWSVTNRVPQFDARLGKLRSVQVTVDGATAPQATVINLDVIPWLIELRTTNTVSVSAGCSHMKWRKPRLPRWWTPRVAINIRCNALWKRIEAQLAVILTPSRRVPAPRGGFRQ